MSAIETAAKQRRQKIQHLASKGASQAEIARQLGVTRQRVWQIMNSMKHRKMFYK